MTVKSARPLPLRLLLGSRELESCNAKRCVDPKDPASTLARTKVMSNGAEVVPSMSVGPKGPCAAALARAVVTTGAGAGAMLNRCSIECGDDRL